MIPFDKRVKELSKNVEIPKGYSQKIEDVLASLPEKEICKKRSWIQSKKAAVAFCLVCVVCLIHFFGMKANANIFESFKLTIMDIFNIGDEEEKKELGVDSKKEHIQSKPDLMIEMQEVVIDPHGIYLLVKITAPTDIVFDEKITFDYFCFCEGENYNVDKMIHGARDCYLLETTEEKSNVATYVMTLTTDMEAYEGKNVTAYFKDLTIDPNEENPELLVEGMWSISFQADLTVRESIEIEGTADMIFPFADTTATLERIEMTALGMMILSDVSNVPFEDLGIVDTSIAIRLKMIDGREICIMPYNPEEEWIIDNGEIENYEEEGKNYQKDTYSFSEAVDITKVTGFYIQEMYVPVD